MLICIEGADHTGKSTIIKLLEKELLRRGRRATSYEFPRGKFIRKTIYKMLDSGTARKWPVLFQSLHQVSRLMFQTFTLPLKSKREVILVGRWNLSMFIYGSVEGVPQWYLELMNSTLVEPDITFVLSSRPRPRSSKDSYEKDELLQQRIKNAYEKSASINNRVIKVENSGTPKETVDRIISLMVHFGGIKL